MWETLEQDGLDVGIPSRVDDGFMREHGVGRAAHRPGQNLHENANRCKTSPPESMYLGWQKLPLRSIFDYNCKGKKVSSVYRLGGKGVAFRCIESSASTSREAFHP